MSDVDEERTCKKEIPEAQAEAQLLAEQEEMRRTGRGRPSGYSPLYAALAEKFCLLGATDLELAHMLGIGQKTLYRWQRQHPQFRQSIKRAKDQADANVVRALYRRALGCWVSDVHTTYHQGTDGCTTTHVTKELPPDPAAAIFWLKNRQRTRWRDRREYAVSKLVREMSDGDIEH